MADPINLNRLRKAKTRAEGKATAAQNRVAFGRTKTERTAFELDAARQARDLDGKKRGD